MSMSLVKNWKPGICTHPEGPDSGVFAPEICCPDRLITFAGNDTEIDCNSTCPHHKNHKPKK